MASALLAWPDVDTSPEATAETVAAEAWGEKPSSPTAAGTLALPDDWRGWLQQVSPHLRAMGPHHERAWNHAEAIEPDRRPRPFVAPFPRKGGKSTTGEHIGSYLGERGKRTYCLWVCGSQTMADQHVASMDSILSRVGGDIATPARNSQNYQRSWRKSEKQTASGYIYGGIGFDSIMRGAKIEDEVPDLIFLDDIDELYDSLYITEKKIQIITNTILPAGASHTAVFFLQNLIIPHGVAARLADGRADFLADRIVDGPHKAIKGIQTEKRYVEEFEGQPVERTIQWITGGEAIWEGQSLRDCQRYIITYGWPAFDREMQQNVQDVEGALWTTEDINRTRIAKKDCPALTRIVVAIDPATTSKSTSDETGIIASGRTANRHGYVLEDETGTYKPAEWGRRAVLMHDRLGADCIVAESNQGGEMIADVVTNAAKALYEEGLRSTPTITVNLIHASKGKRARAEPVSQMYDEEAVHHVGDLPDLENEMTTWDASDGSESPNRIDALVWGMTELGIIKTTQAFKPVNLHW